MTVLMALVVILHDPLRNGAGCVSLEFASLGPGAGLE